MGARSDSRRTDVQRTFEDVGLSESSSDLEVRNVCTVESLPVFTIADVSAFRTSDVYVERVVKALYDYLLRIDEVRRTGRLYLP